MVRPFAALLFLTAFAAPLIPSAAAAPPPGEVTGTVVDAAGDPVAGAEVGRITAGGPVYETRTAADGSFALPAPPGVAGPNLPYLIARGPGGDLGVGPERPKSGDFPATVRLTPPHELTVSVAAADGSPAVGVPVYARARFRPVAVGPTERDGTVTLPVPADAPLMQTVALKPGVGFAYTRHDLNGERGELAPMPERVSLKLSPPVEHRVTVLAADPAGGPSKPLPGARVSVWLVQTPGEPNDANLSGLEAAYTTAGPDGVAVLDWLPADAVNRIPLNVSAEGFGPARTFVPTGDESDADSPGFDPTATPEAQAVTLQPAATFAGRVTHADGSPAAGVMVRAEGQNWHLDTTDYERDTAFTGPDGRWEMEVRGDASYLVVPLPGPPSMFEEFPPPGGLAAAALGRDEPVTVEPGGRLDGLDFTLTEGTLVTGLVTRGGEPVADHGIGLSTRGAAAPDNAKQTVNGDRLGLPRWTKTDADGRYAFRVGPGEHSVTPFGGAVDGDRLVVASDEPGTVTRDITLKPEPEPTVVAGQVVDEYGLPLAGIAVTVADQRAQAARGAGVTVATDADGRFRLERISRNGWRRWFLLAGGYDEARGQVLGFDDLDLATTDVSDLRVTLARAATVTGRVTVGEKGADGGPAPLAGVPVVLRYNAPFMDDDPPPFAYRAVTGPAGRVTFRGPPGGADYYLAPEVEVSGGAILPWVVPDADAPDVGEIAMKGSNDPPPAADRRRWAFAVPPAGSADVVKDLRADAAALGRNALLLVADPDSDAGRDLFAAVYDDPDLSAAADAGFLTRCLPPAKPGDADPLPGRAGVDPAAATLTALTADGRVLGLYEHAVGNRDALAAFLAAHRPDAD